MSNKRDKRLCDREYTDLYHKFVATIYALKFNPEKSSRSVHAAARVALEKLCQMSNQDIINEYTRILTKDYTKNAWHALYKLVILYRMEGEKPNEYNGKR